MASFASALIWAGMGVLVVTAAVRLRHRLRERWPQDGPEVDDDAVRRILETGRLTSAEEPPLDLEEIEEAEERFWSEPWDEPDY
jgi:hypothetical protein